MVVKKQVGEITFGMVSPTLIRQMSAVEVTVSELYDQDGFPVEGGLMDPKMGVVDPGVRCRTCGANVGTCPGHFGQIELARPVIHIRFAKKIYKFLTVTCSECGRVKLSSEVLDRYRARLEGLIKRENLNAQEQLVKDIYRLARKAKECSHCGSEAPEIKYEKPSAYFKEKKRMTPIDIRDHLERIPDEDLIFIGMNPEVARPEWSLLTALAVPPVTVRPSITLETGERAEDDLTHKLVDIMRINMRLKENMSAGAPAVIVEDLWDLLQYHVTTFIDNNVSSIPPARHRAGRVLKGLTQRIKSKQGRFRHNLVGKRVNFSARTVISPDSSIEIDEVGVPEEMVFELTIPEIATERNIDALKEILMKGPEDIDGANYVLMPDGRRKKVTDSDKETLCEELAPGMIVERHLRDGDTALFNRQPSLHKLSLMAHRIRILSGHSFRINPAICLPYNADFDGDEMNLHIPQTYEAMVEANSLMSVRENLRSPRFGGPIIGGHQDHLSASYLLTRDGTVLTKEETAQLLFTVGLEPKLKKKSYTGKEIFSFILPKDLNIAFKSRACKSFACDSCLKESCEHDAYVVIKKGELIKGVIDDAAFGAFAGKLLDAIIQEYGTKEGITFLNRCTGISLAYLRSYGFTVCTDDFRIPKRAKKLVDEVLDDGEENVKNLIAKFEAGNLEAWPGMTPKETLENELMGVLNKARDAAVEIVRENLTSDNNAVVMAITGARGKLLNIAQMSACLGQQAVGGARINRGFSGRTTPHFKKGDFGARSRGFVRSSYGSGLNPLEFFWVAMTGREGLTDTSMRTPKSGYMYRRLVNAMQDLRLEYDRTVRDNRGTIIQFTYGEDGQDPAKTDFGGIDIERAAQKVGI